jgi:type I restriction enzyme S subunit
VKPSGLDWSPEVPAHWTVKKLGFVASLQSGEAITAEDIKDTGLHPVYGGNGLRGYTDAFTHRGHYVLVGRQGALCGNVNYANGEFWASEHALVATPREPISVIWFGELLRAMNLNQYSVSAAQPGLAVEAITALKIPVPPFDEQNAIADLLDGETARLDALVAAKERWLELLAEKRRVLMTRAVTRGLDPAVPLRDSGLGWLGQIPMHWRVKRLKFVSPFITVGIVVTPSKYYQDKGVPCLRSLNVKDTGLVDDELVYISEESHEELAKSKVNAGDLVIVRSGQPGTTAVVDKRFDGANCIDLIIVRRPQTEDSHFLAHFLNSDVARAEFGGGSGGAIQQHFNIETAKDLAVALPSLDEQRAIVAYISAETAKLDALRAATERTIDLLKERRAALIAAAVTGQLIS